MNRAAAVLFCVLLAGCERNPATPGAATFTPAPRSLSSRAEVYADAARWAMVEPSRYYAAVAATHSMEPVINEHSVILCQRYTGQTLANGAVVIINEPNNGPRVLHVIATQNADSVFMSGYANSRSDGWYPKRNIEGYVVGQLYLPN